MPVLYNKLQQSLYNFAFTTRLTLIPNLLLQVPLCRTTIYIQELLLWAPPPPTLIEQFIYGNQCVELLHLIASCHYLVLRTFFVGLIRFYGIQFLTWTCHVPGLLFGTAHVTEIKIMI
jgi:hypothetical protein